MGLSGCVQVPGANEGMVALGSFLPRNSGPVSVCLTTVYTL